MSDIFLTITTYTYKKINTLPGKRKHNALSLYMFYYYHAKFQETNKPWATIGFCSKGLGWAEPTTRRSKQDLERLGLIETEPASGRNNKSYIKINYITKSNTKEDILCTTKNMQCKKSIDKCLKSKKDKCLKKRKTLSKDKVNDSDESFTFNADKFKKTKRPKIKTNSDQNNSDNSDHKNTTNSKEKNKSNSTNSDHKAKYSHTTTDYRNYNEIKSHGATNHRKGSKAELDSLDKLHALFSSKCKDPYYMVHVPEQYIDFKWDMDDLIEVFTFHLKHAAEFNMKPIKSIGKFILTESFNGYKAFSPLLTWHQKMKKTAKNELTENGKKFFQSLKRKKVDNLEELESSIINKVAEDLFNVSYKYVFMDGKNETMTYPFGIADALSKYIKEQTNRVNFKLVYITKDGFVDEFIETARKRNIIKKKSNGRSLYQENQ